MKKTIAQIICNLYAEKLKVEIKTMLTIPNGIIIWNDYINIRSYSSRIKKAITNEKIMFL